MCNLLSSLSVQRLGAMECEFRSNLLMVNIVSEVFLFNLTRI